IASGGTNKFGCIFRRLPADGPYPREALTIFYQRHVSCLTHDPVNGRVGPVRAGLEPSHNIPSTKTIAWVDGLCFDSQAVSSGCHRFLLEDCAQRNEPLGKDHKGK